LPYVKKTYRQIAKDILTQICGGETAEEHDYVVGKTSYELSSIPVTGVKMVEGTFKGSKKLFVKDTDYKLTADSVEWLGGGDHPDQDTSFTVQYTFRRASAISDVNPGSVVRTIAEAISREIEYLYLQMEEAYLSGFLDTATGDALDMVVSILGIKRKPPLPSSGYVTFGRSTEPEILAVNSEVHLYDGSLEYALNKQLIKEIAKIEGTIKESPVTFEKDVDYTLAGKNVRWLPGGKKPDTKTVFRVDYSAYREIAIPKGTNVTTFSTRPEETRLFTTTDETSLAATREGKWETETPVICTTPGRWGNVLAGTVTVMPQPIQSVEYVINKADITNGVEIEGDSELKERAKHALEFAGKATHSSLESAIRSIEGVRSLFIEDMPEKVSGIVKVIVDGGDMDKISHIIDETRAAGIKVEVFRPKIVYINVSLTLILEKEVSPTGVATQAEKQIRGYLSSLEIGDDVLFSRIIDSVLSDRSVRDVKNVRISAHRGEAEIVESEMENIEISSEERAEPRTINISFEMRK
jgi:hypothetical protein